MSSGQPPTREKQLNDAIEKARLPPRDYRVYRALFRRAEWGSAVIKAEWQPKSLKRIAADSQLSVATVCRSLAHLESHGWVARERSQRRGRGYATAYQLLAGQDCDCMTQKPEPKSDAERARRYRERKRFARSTDQSSDVEPIGPAMTSVKQPGGNLLPDVSHVPVTPPAESVSDSRDEVSQPVVSNRLASRDELAVQTAFSGKEDAAEGEGGQRAALCAVCRTPMHPVLPANGYRTHPCCDPSEVSPLWPPGTAHEIL